MPAPELCWRSHHRPGLFLCRCLPSAGGAPNASCTRLGSRLYKFDFLKLWPKRREVEMSDNRHPTCADWIGCVFALILSLNALPTNAGVFSTTDVLAKTGQSIDAWGAAWWQNAFVHPDLLIDTTGEFGYLGNVGGPVFFAEGSGGGPVSLSYTVPNNQYILLPVATYIWTFFG